MTKTALENKKIDTENQKVRETRRANKVNEKEHARHNVATEITEGMKGAGSILKGISALNSPAWYKPFFKAESFTAEIPAKRNSQTALRNVLMKGSNLKPVVIPACRCYYYYSSLGGEFEQKQNILNQSLIKLKADLRASNSRIGGYESGDLGQYLIACTEVFAIMENWRKAIKATLTHERDSNVSKLGTMIAAQCGFKPKEMKDNIEAHIARFNELADRINKVLWVPKPFNYCERKIFMASAIFADDDLAMSQVTHFRAYQYGRYDEEMAEIVFTSSINYGYMDLDAIVTRVENMINPLEFSAFVSELTSDIINGYGTSRAAYYNVDIVAKTDRLVIPHATEPLHQLMNAICAPVHIGKRPAVGASANYTWCEFQLDPSDNITDFGSSTLSETFFAFQPRNGSDNIRQDAHGLIYQGVSITEKLGVELKWANPNNTNTALWPYNDGNLTLPLQVYTDAKNCMLNFYQDSLSADELVVATRLRPVFSKDTTNLFVYAHTCGTELLAFCITSKCYTAGYGNYNILSKVQFGIENTTTTSVVDDELYLVDDLSFDWNPMKIYYAGGNISQLTTQYGNVTILGHDNLELVNLYCLEGLFSIGQQVKSNPKNSFKV